MNSCKDFSPYLGFVKGCDVMTHENGILQNACFEGSIKAEKFDPMSSATTVSCSDMEWNEMESNYGDDGLQNIFTDDLFENSVENLLSDDPPLAATINNNLLKSDGCCGSTTTYDPLTTSSYGGYNITDNEDPAFPPNTVPFGDLTLQTYLGGQLEMTTSTSSPDDDDVVANGDLDVLQNYFSSIDQNGDSLEEFLNNTNAASGGGFQGEDELMEPVDVVVGDSKTVVRLSPTYSSSSSDSSDSGVSTDESNAAGMMEQQLSPLSLADYAESSPDYSPSRHSLGSISLSPPSSSPPHSFPTSGYPSSSSSPTGARSPLLGAAPAVLTSSSSFPGGDLPTQYITTTTCSNTTNSTNQTRQFCVQKRPHSNKYTINNNGCKNLRNCFTNNNNNNKQPITIVSTSNITPITAATNNPRLGGNISPTTTTTTSTTKISPTIISRSQVVNCTKTLSKSSPSPSVVTLSGVNKTSGVIKSPSVINVTRKQNNNTFTSNNQNIINSHSSSTNSPIIGSNNSGSGNGVNVPKPILLNNNNNSSNGQFVQKSSLPQVLHKPFSVIASSGEVLTSSSSPVYKTVTVSSATSSRLTAAGGVGPTMTTTSSGQQIILTPARSANVAKFAPGTLLKSSSNNSLYIPISGKDMSKMQVRPYTVRNFKIVNNNGSSSSATTTFVKNGRTFMLPANRSRTITGVTTVNGIKTTMLKNFNVVGSKTVVSKDGVLIPKEEIDSDDDIELPKNNQPLNLSDEEKKLAAKEKIKFPSHYPLNRMQEKELKRIKRKIRNKISAQDSRKRKKEYMDRLEDRITASSDENDRLKMQLATLEEKNKELAQQLKHFQSMMSAQPTSNSSGHSSRHHHHHQQNPTNFLLLMILSVALFIYPSVMPDGKASELLTAVSHHHKMPPAGNSRSLLEAASKLSSVCADDDGDDSSIIDVVESKGSIAALSDHDYAPPTKKGRFEYAAAFRDDDNYCMPQLDELPPPKKTRNLGDGRKWGGAGGPDGGGGDHAVPPAGEFTTPTEGGSPLSSSSEDEQLTTPKIELKEEQGSDQTLFAKISQGILDSMMKHFETSNSNWTDREDRKPAKDHLAQSLVVELATPGTKRFREDIELE